MKRTLEGLGKDYVDFLRELDAAGAEFVIVGGWAMAAHGHPRATKDLDVFVRPTKKNAERVFAALARFGANLRGITVEDFARPGLIIQVGVVLRVDVTTVIDGVDFDEALRDAIDIGVDGFNVRVIGRSALIQNKRASGRAQDRADVRKLERASPPRKKARKRR
jgi:predicted nucleotidyltransferase